MPLLELTYVEGSLDESTRSALVADLTAVLMKWEGVPDVPFFRAATWVQLHERPGWAINQAGAPAAETLYLLSATVPAGALSDRRKAGLIDDATSTILKADGGAQDPHRVWVHIHEMPDGTWGAGGQPVIFEQLKQAAAASSAQVGKG